MKRFLSTFGICLALVEAFIFSEDTSSLISAGAGIWQARPSPWFWRCWCAFWFIRMTGWRRWKNGPGSWRNKFRNRTTKRRRYHESDFTAGCEGPGKKGQMVEVSEGYARNFLLPRKLAIAATADAINTMNLKEKARKAEEARQKAEAEATAEKLKECMVKLTAKAGNGGRLFGAVTTKEISDGLRQQFGIDIPKQKLVLDEPIKAFGSYQVKAKLGFEVNGTVYVSVFEEK